MSSAILTIFDTENDAQAKAAALMAPGEIVNYFEVNAMQLKTKKNGNEETIMQTNQTVWVVMAVNIS